MCITTFKKLFVCMTVGIELKALAVSCISDSFLSEVLRQILVTHKLNKLGCTKICYPPPQPLALF